MSEGVMDWGKECRKWHDLGIESLLKFGRTPFMLRIYPHHLEDACVVWVEIDGLTDDARAKLHMLNSMFRGSNPAAILTQADAWSASNERFALHFGLPEGLPIEKFQVEYHRILKQQFGGSLANVPDEAKSETLFTTIKGPAFAGVNIVTKYHREGRKVVIEGEEKMDCMVSNLIPDWWKVRVQ